MKYYIAVLKKYVVFEGRAGRAEYWYFVLFNIIFSLILSFIDRSNFLTRIYSLALFFPSLGVSVRRLHDTNRSGWWVLIGLIPIIGWIVLIVFMASASQPGKNQYGSHPHEIK